MRLTRLTTRLILCGALLGCSFSQAAQPSAAPPVSGTAAAAGADIAWAEILKESQPPQPPAAWRNAQPSEEEFQKFQANESARVTRAATKAGEFLARFPKDRRADEARAKEYDLLAMAAQLGNTNVLSRLDVLDAAKLQNPKLPEEERFRIKFDAVNRTAMSKLAESRTSAFAELEKGARGLLKEFPNRPESYQMLQFVALESETEKAVKLAKELTEGAAPTEVKDAVKPLLRLGKPLAIKFAAVDGRQVDLSKLRGKVVLVDFWATWCGPCVQELPNVRAAYEKLQPKGFEILGISFDREKEELVSFVKEHKMPWPQYFDGKYWDNDFGKQFGIQSIPAMWLVDKKGNLRDINAREDLAEKVEKLLAEQL